MRIKLIAVFLSFLIISLSAPPWYLHNIVNAAQVPGIATITTLDKFPSYAGTASTPATAAGAQTPGTGSDAQGISSSDTALSQDEINLIVFGGAQTSSFNSKRNGGVAHQAIDIAPRSGGTRAVTSPVSGTLKDIVRGGGELGQYVVVQAGDGSTWKFGHLDLNAYAPRTTQITPCTTIGAIYNGAARPGESSTGPHVHIEYQKPDGSLADPTTVLKSTIAAGTRCNAGTAFPFTSTYTAGSTTSATQRATIDEVNIIATPKDKDSAKADTQICAGTFDIEIELTGSGFTNAQQLPQIVVSEGGKPLRSVSITQQVYRTDNNMKFTATISNLADGTHTIEAAAIYTAQPYEAKQSTPEKIEIIRGALCNPYHAVLILKNAYNKPENFDKAIINVAGGSCSYTPSETEANRWTCSSSQPSPQVTIEVPEGTIKGASSGAAAFTRSGATTTATVPVAAPPAATAAAATPPAEAPAPAAPPPAEAAPAASEPSVASVDEGCKDAGGTCETVSEKTGGRYVQGVCKSNPAPDYQCWSPDTSVTDCVSCSTNYWWCSSDSNQGYCGDTPTVGTPPTCISGYSLVSDAASCPAAAAPPAGSAASPEQGKIPSSCNEVRNNIIINSPDVYQYVNPDNIIGKLRPNVAHSVHVYDTRGVQSNEVLCYSNNWDLDNTEYSSGYSGFVKLSDIRLQSTPPTSGRAASQNIAGKAASAAPSPDYIRYQRALEFSPVGEATINEHTIKLVPNLAPLTNCEACTSTGYTWCPTGSTSSDGACSGAACAQGTGITDKDRCPAKMLDDALDNLDKTKDRCEVCVTGGVWCRAQNGNGNCAIESRDYPKGENLNNVCRRLNNGRPILNPDACSRFDDVMEDIIWNEIFAFASRALASRNTPKFVPPPTNWKPTDSIEVPAAVMSKRRTHVCEAVSAARINAEIDKSNAISTQGSAPLFQAGDAVSIKGTVDKFSSTCNGVSFNCRAHEVLGCKVEDKFPYFWITLKYQKCEGEFNTTVHKEGIEPGKDSKKIWDWAFIFTAAASALIPMFTSNAPTGVTRGGQPDTGTSDRFASNPFAGGVQYYQNQGGASQLLGFLSQARGGSFSRDKDWYMRSAIAFVAGFVGRPDINKERCFTVCGKVFETKDPSKDTCDSEQSTAQTSQFTTTQPTATTAQQNQKRGTVVTAPVAVLSYKETTYGSEFQCAQNTACGLFGNAPVAVSLISPVGAVSDLGDTRTDSVGNIDFSFSAPSADGTFNAVLKTKGVPPVQPQAQQAAQQGVRP